MAHSAGQLDVRVKRSYQTPSPDDGFRVLVDRLWPRGLTKDHAAIDLWLKELAPSAELRRWFGHDAGRWDEFRRRYQEELAQKEALLDELRQRAEAGRLTLVYAARDERRNQAVVLCEILERSFDAPAETGRQRDAASRNWTGAT